MAMAARGRDTAGPVAVAKLVPWGRTRIGTWQTGGLFKGEMVAIGGAAVRTPERNLRGGLKGVG